MGGPGPGRRPTGLRKTTVKGKKHTTALLIKTERGFIDDLNEKRQYNIRHPLNDLGGCCGCA